MALLPLLPGAWQDALDEQGLAILKADRALRGHAHSDKKDWFTVEQLALRQNREIQPSREVNWSYTAGLYRRAYNPLRGTRPSRAGRYSLRQDPWRQDGYESFDWGGGMLPSVLRADRMVEGGAHYTWDIMATPEA